MLAQSYPFVLDYSFDRIIKKGIRRWLKADEFGQMCSLRGGDGLIQYRELMLWEITYHTTDFNICSITSLEQKNLLGCSLQVERWRAGKDKPLAGEMKGLTKNDDNDDNVTSWSPDGAKVLTERRRWFDFVQRMNDMRNHLQLILIFVLSLHTTVVAYKTKWKSNEPWHHGIIQRQLINLNLNLI